MMRKKKKDKIKIEKIKKIWVKQWNNKFVN